MNARAKDATAAPGAPGGMYQPNEHLRNPYAGSNCFALWGCPAHAFCEPTEEEIAAARDRIEAREASGTAPTP